MPEAVSEGVQEAQGRAVFSCVVLPGFSGLSEEDSAMVLLLPDTLIGLDSLDFAFGETVTGLDVFLGLPVAETVVAGFEVTGVEGTVLSGCVVCTVKGTEEGFSFGIEGVKEPVF